MALSNYNKEQIDAFKKQLLEHVPDDGNAIGNITLRDTRLQWDKEKYSAVKNLLIKEGKLELGRGKGGSVKLPLSSIENADANVQEGEGVMPDAQKGDQAMPDAENAAIYGNEQALYDPMMNVLKGDWIPEQGFKDFVMQATAQNGASKDGKWARPDITVLAYTTYAYVPRKVFDIVTFEVKFKGKLDVTAVYEALSHKKAATKSYVLAWISGDNADSDAVADVADAARLHGIGLITAIDPTNYDTWEIVVDAVRTDPDPARLNRFLVSQIEQNNRDAWREWFQYG